MFEPLMEFLPSAQQQLWSELRPAASLGFALYGGTAIALRLGHRISVDFDFFTERSLDRDTIMATFPCMKRAVVLQDQHNKLSVLIPGGGSEAQDIKLSFIGSIGVGRCGQPDLTADGVLQVASLDDLIATKVKVILQRVDARDYCDIAAMIDADVSLAKGLAAAREMYGVSFQPSESLKALVYFKGGDLATLQTRHRNIIIEAVSAKRKLPKASTLTRQLTVSRSDRDD